MASLARAHRERIHAAELARQSGIADAVGRAPEIEPGSEAANEYAQLNVLLESNLRTLSEIQSIAARNPIKAEMAVAFAPWIEGVLEAGREGAATQDAIVVTNMIWAMDYHAYDYALDIAEHVLAHGLSMPERFARAETKAATFVAESIAESFIAAATAGETSDAASVTHSQLLRANAMTEAADMPDQARAKMAKALGMSFAQQAEIFEAEADNAVAGGKPALSAHPLNSLNVRWNSMPRFPV
jgi:hypothetical protein